jgi:formylglycine-generating enzyme required for sulfatase activity
VERVPIDSTFFEMVLLDGGSFLMGSQDGDDDESPVHEVTLRPFSIGRYEVTQRQWEIVMGTRPSYFTACADCPVDGVSWNDTQLFIAELNRQSGKQFRLPSEAEWEYACLAGGSETYCGDSDETRVAWYAENSGGSSQPVGLLAPNGFGLYDMSGNAYEWVADCWHGGYGDAPVDGSAWASGDCQRRVLRGGAWYYAAAYALSTYRNANTPGSRFITYGFRLARDE